MELRFLLAAASIALCGCAGGGGGERTAGDAPPEIEAAKPSRALVPAGTANVSASQLREQAISLLNEAALGPRADVRANALEALLATPSRAEPLVRAALRDQNDGVRAIAAMCVGRAKLADLCADVDSLVSDGAIVVRLSALYALARCDRQIDLTPIGRALFNDPSAKVRSHAAFLLGELGNRGARAMLMEAAAAKSSDLPATETRLLHLQIAEALVKLGEGSAIQEIRAALYPSRPEDLEAAALAAQILGQVRDRGSADQLVFLTARRDEQGRMPAEVRLAAAGSLAQIGNQRGSFLALEYIADPNPALRAQAAFVLGRTGRSDNLETLETLLVDTDTLVQVAAADAILRCTGRN